MIHLTTFSENLQQDKYRLPNENYEEMCSRLSGALCDGEDHRRVLKDIFLAGRYTLAGRALSSVGNPDPDQTAHNCYMGGEIKDNLTKEGGIFQRLVECVQTMSMGGGYGINFATIRPKDKIASGPVSFMSPYSISCHVTARGGKKGRGALMAMNRIDHPDIMEYITCKRPPQEASVLYELMEEYPHLEGELQGVLSKLMPLTGFNCSIYITDEFMEALQNRTSYTLRFNGEEYGTLDAYKVWETIMRNTWEYGDPGLFFGDTANQVDNLWYLPQKIVGTNPCGEKPFRPHMSCLLGSFNLVRYLLPYKDEAGKIHYQFQMSKLEDDVHHIVRAMDNIVDLSNYPLPEQAYAAQQDRQLGIGVMGMANTIEALGFDYGSEEYLEVQDSILKAILHHSYYASSDLSKEKESFPLYDPKKYHEGRFIQTLPEDVQEYMKRWGVRNSHLTSIAPTGTISLAYNNVSPGIEPTFAKKQRRIMKQDGEDTIVELEDYGVKFLGNNPKTALECTVDEHLQVLLRAQRYVDSAVSKTVNVPHSTPWNEFKDIYRKAYHGGAKGITTFTTGGKKRGILESLDTPSCELNPLTGEKSCG